MTNPIPNDPPGPPKTVLDSVIRTVGDLRPWPDLEPWPVVPDA